MKVFRTIAEIAPSAASSVSVGTFDGVHRGHQVILDKVKSVAVSRSLVKTIVTFDPHPQKVVGKVDPDSIKILCTIEEKISIFEQSGIDQLVIIPFTRDFASLTSEQFVETVLLDRLQAREVVVGYDHHFGRNREGGFENLRAQGELRGFGTYQVPPFEYMGEILSSTKIRNLVSEGRVRKAAEWIGRNYQLSGTVTRGDGRGRQIGFPTANIAVDHSDKLIPARGVYAVDAQLDGEVHKGMMNIGIRPTFDFDFLTLEVHLFNFDAVIYGKTLKIEFKEFIRPERKFSGIEELTEQLNLDKEVCVNL